MLSDRCKDVFRKIYPDFGSGRMPRADALIAQAAERARRPVKGEWFPAVEYNWERHGFDVGVKDAAGNWIKRFVWDCGTPGEARIVAMHFRCLADALERHEKEGE